MSHWDLITNLPAIISCEILCHWLEAKEISRLDSAYCNKTLRSRVVAMYEADEFVLSHCVEATDESLVWLTLKKIRVYRIEIGDENGDVVEVDSTLLANYLVECGTTVKFFGLGLHSTPQNMETVAQHCTQLTTFKCFSVPVYLHFREILERNLNLQVLDFGGIYPECTSFEDISLPRLHTVSFNHCTFIDDCLELIPQMSKNIERLDVYLCNNVEVDTLLTTIHQCPKLIALGLGGLALSDDVLRDISALCPNVYNLAVMYNPFLTDAGLLRILQNMPFLKILDIQNCRALTDLALTHITTHCANVLEVLLIGEKMSFSVPAVAQLVTKCTKLRIFSWSATRDFLCADDKHLQQAFVGLRNIQTLLLGDGMACDAALRLVGEHCKQLQNLDLYSYTPYETDSDYEPENEEQNNEVAVAALHYTTAGVRAVAVGCSKMRTVVCGSDVVLNDEAKLTWQQIQPQVRFSTDDLPFCSSIMYDPM